MVRRYYFDDRERNFATLILGLTLSVALWAFLISRASFFDSLHQQNLEEHQAAVGQYDQEFAKLNFFQARFFRARPTEPQHPAAGAIAAAIFIPLLVFFPICYYFCAEPALIGYEKWKEFLAERKVQNEQRKMLRIQAQAERESQQQLQSQQMMNGVQEVIQLLGSINQYVIVFQNEKDNDRKVICLQQVSVAITNLISKRASGEIPASAFRVPQVSHCAKETLSDLRASGLGNNSFYRSLENCVSGR